MEHRNIAGKAIDDLKSEIRQLSQGIHEHPELGYEEVYAHDTITAFLEKQGFNVKRHTYGLKTSFESEVGSGGRLVVYCAEYDSLPGIGHACGHNLIAISSIAAFIGAARLLQASEGKGRVRLLGTPAEEGLGGKVKLIEAGAFEDEIAAAIMCHPISARWMTGDGYEGYSGIAGPKFIASHKLKVEYKGRTAHAAGEPWNGINALDAAVAAYNNISLLRQQIQPDDRIHGVIEVGGTVPNVITDYARMNWYIRSPSMQRADTLLKRAKLCFEAAAQSTGCSHNYIDAPTYMNLRANKTLCDVFVEEMNALGETIKSVDTKPTTASTDMGNVSHVVPSLHSCFGIPTEEGVSIHNPGFAAAAGTEKAHEAAIRSAKGMAMLGWKVLTDDALAVSARQQFDQGEG